MSGVVPLDCYQEGALFVVWLLVALVMINFDLAALLLPPVVIFRSLSIPLLKPL